MNRILLSWLNAPLFVLLALIGVGLQTSLFSTYPLMYLQPDLVLLAVVWCGLKRGFIEGGILTLILSNIAEVHSSAPQGLLLMSYMGIYLLIRLTAKLFVIPNFNAMIMLTLAASVIWKLENLLALHFLALAGQQWRHTLVFLMPGAVIEGVVALWVFRALDRFDWITFKNPRAHQAVQDELSLEGEGL